jgi:hypothetical protein
MADATDQRDWHAWHQPYDEAGSPLAIRLALVQQRIRVVLDAAPAGPIDVVSACAGQGRDLLGVLADHPRRGDVRARLVELDARLAEDARNAVPTDLSNVDVVTGDASTTSAYAGAVPADLVLFCGVFGNITDDDIHYSVDHLSMLCAHGATVIWTRHRKPPDLTPTIRQWFSDAGYDELAWDAPDEVFISVGTHRLMRNPVPLEPDIRLFTFLDYDTFSR